MTSEVANHLRLPWSMTSELVNHLRPRMVHDL